MREAEAIIRGTGRAVAPGAAGAAREISVDADELLELLAALKALGDFMLFDIAAVDRPEGFRVTYRLLDRGGEGPTGFFTVAVKVPKDEPRLPSAMGIWKAADVMEREVWDLMGIRFEGRDGLKRILCKDDFEGHPLRKDYPVKKRQPRIGPVN